MDKRIFLETCLYVGKTFSYYKEKHEKFPIYGNLFLYMDNKFD